MMRQTKITRFAMYRKHRPYWSNMQMMRREQRTLLEYWKFKAKKQTTLHAYFGPGGNKTVFKQRPANMQRKRQMTLHEFM